MDSYRKSTDRYPHVEIPLDLNFGKRNHSPRRKIEVSAVRLQDHEVVFLFRQRVRLEFYRGDPVHLDVCVQVQLLLLRCHLKRGTQRCVVAFVRVDDWSALKV